MCFIWHDGAGAMILSSDKKNGILSTKIYSDGHWIDSLYADKWAIIKSKVGKIRMKGKDIFKQAVTKKLSQATISALKKNVI